MYFNDSTAEKYVLSNNWGGEISNSKGDYLDVVDTNIDGYKTDLVTKENVSYTAQIEGSSVIDSVNISRTNNGGNSQYTYYNKPNIDFMRVYVPLGSRLISASGFTAIKPKFSNFDYKGNGFQSDPNIARVENEMVFNSSENVYTYTEFGKTVFAGWVVTNPGSTTDVSLSYSLPSEVFDGKELDLLAQKEPGKTASLNINVNAPYGEGVELLGSGNSGYKSHVSFSGSWDTDKLYKFSVMGYNE